MVPVTITGPWGMSAPFPSGFPPFFLFAASAIVTLPTFVTLPLLQHNGLWGPTVFALGSGNRCVWVIPPRGSPSAQWSRQRSSDASRYCSFFALDFTRELVSSITGKRLDDFCARLRPSSLARTHYAAFVRHVRIAVSDGPTSFAPEWGILDIS